jgi:hypothetical protein
MTRDFSQIARDVVDRASRQPSHRDEEADAARHARAVESGRQGGRKGGKSRAEQLTAEERSESARKAARARWSTK